MLSSYIVQAASADAAKSAVMKVGGRVTATLNIINAVGAELSEDQIECLRAEAERIRIFVDGTLEVSGRKPGGPKTKKPRDSGEQPGSHSTTDGAHSEPVAETHYPTLIGAADLHKRGITGKGVTVAILDTGLWKSPTTEFTADGKPRILAQYDATTRNENNNDLDDWNGHGTHVTSIMMSSGRSEAGRYQGIAPNASVVAVRAFEPDGAGTYLNVIKALDWIVSNRKKYGIRILNLSFGAPAASHYWDDPVNQAVMAAWKSGIIVVVAAGNGGPGAMTVGVPGNVPYVITVGAMTDNFTPEDRTDDKLTTFSAAGPTFEGFVKPDLLAPGGHMLGQMPPYAWLPLEHPEYVDQIGDYFTMSGTSQATAVVSGVLALMLQAEPKLKPDDAKCRLIASARAAVRDDGIHAYTIFQQGAGLVDAVAAVNESAAGCANHDLNIKEDLAGQRHYAGLAGVDDLGTYYLVDEYGQRMFGPGYEWAQGSL
jgi:serine protease AprX